VGGQTVLARAVIASDTRRIADPPRLKFLSRKLLVLSSQPVWT